MDISQIRNDYQAEPITNLPKEPHVALEHWLSEALRTEAEATAFSLATAGDLQAVSVRVVLAKAITAEGITFFTNGLSLKGRQLKERAVAAGVFFWPSLMRQVRFEGKPTRVPDAEADQYFATRPRESQIAAAASAQSEPVASYEILLEKYAVLEKELAGKEVKRPAHWGGYIISLERVEFWQGQPNRLHQRLVFEKTDKWGYRQTWLQP